MKYDPDEVNKAKWFLAHEIGCDDCEKYKDGECEECTRVFNNFGRMTGIGWVSKDLFPAVDEKPLL